MVRHVRHDQRRGSVHTAFAAPYMDLAPALDAGMILPGSHEEWASVLIAADALVTDHGSAALYYCATQDRPVVSVHPGGGELIPDSPMDVLLDRIPRLGRAEDIIDALRAYRRRLRWRPPCQVARRGRDRSAVPARVIRGRALFDIPGQNRAWNP
ncbi:hypothetical protein ACW4TU_25635 [Streptomyces sp. QTS52]